MAPACTHSCRLGACVCGGGGGGGAGLLVMLCIAHHCCSVPGPARPQCCAPNSAPAKIQPRAPWPANCPQGTPPCHALIFSMCSGVGRQVHVQGACHGPKGHQNPLWRCSETATTCAAADFWAQLGNIESIAALAVAPKCSRLIDSDPIGILQPPDNGPMAFIFGVGASQSAAG